MIQTRQVSVDHLITLAWEKPGILDIYADGSCLGNPGPGGWAYVAVLRRDDGVYYAEKAGRDPHATNNRMELTAVIAACTMAQISPPCTVYTDSMYTCKGANDWMAKWRDNNWIMSGGRPPTNLDLWKELDTLLSIIPVDIRWVKGHAGHQWQEFSDSLARSQAKSFS